MIYDNIDWKLVCAYLFIICNINYYISNFYETKEEKLMPKKTEESTKKVVSKKVNSSKRSPKATSVVKKTPEKKTTTKSKSATKVPAKSKSTTSKKKTTKSTVAKKSKLNSTKTSNIIEYYDLPYKYNKTVVKILSQTPKTLFVYWEISDEDSKKFIESFGNDFFNKTVPVLIVNNITKNYSFEIQINDFANSWYFDISDDKCKYTVELGRRPISTEIFIPNNYVYIASSNKIEAPNGHILFDKSQKAIYFRNTKTNETYSKNIANLHFMKYINKIYNVSDFYKKIYKDENIFDINNPTSDFK